MNIKGLTKAILTVSLPLFCLNCGHKNEEKQQLRNVVLAPVEGLSGSQSTQYPGVIEEGASINASFMADGKIATINVKEGDRVHKGQLIATLDATDYRLGVAQLEAQYEQMTREKERMDAMFEKRNIAPNDYEKFTTGYQQLKLQLEMARRKLDYTRLYAPSNGYVASKYLNAGELTGAGTPVVNIIDDTQLMASVDMPVSAYLERRNIASASGQVPGIAGDFPLSIVSFTPDADNNMLYHLKLSIPANVARELTPGMNISVSIRTTDGDRNGALIPSRAIFKDKNETFVWVFNTADSTIHKKAVTILGQPDGRLSSVTGLEPDDKVIETGVKQLYEGEKVNVLNRQETGI